MRISTYEKPRIIACAEDLPEHLVLPRGCFDEVLELFRDLKINSKTDDQRHPGEPVEFAFHGTLRPDQETAAAAMLAHDTGVLAATTAFGRTVPAANLIDRRCEGYEAIGYTILLPASALPGWPVESSAPA